MFIISILGIYSLSVNWVLFIQFLYVNGGNISPFRYCSTSPNSNCSTMGTNVIHYQAVWMSIVYYLQEHREAVGMYLLL